MVTREYLNKIIKDFKSKYKNLTFDLYLEELSNGGYCWTICIDCYVTKDFIINSGVYISNDLYDAPQRIAIQKPYISLNGVDEQFVTSAKYFEKIGNKGAAGFNEIKDCLNYFNKTYKQDIRKLL